MNQHVHIPEADRHIIDLVGRHVRHGRRRVLEIGCGPARLLRQLDQIEGVHLTGLDHDQSFVDTGREIIAQQGRKTPIICTDIAMYHPDDTFDIAVSQGMHHHIPKDEVPAYLENVRRLLVPSGYYIVGDEFLTQYQGEVERRIIATLWYAHVIASAIRGGHQQLGVEEAKTLLDDLAMGEETLKSNAQLELVLESVEQIESLVEQANLYDARAQAQMLLTELMHLRPTHSTGDARLDLSRGDFKVDGTAFREEVVRAGFRVLDTRWFGPIDVSGAMGVFILQKGG
jgi:SAM-dependent methyltransferase